ncbi:hypothetical protein D3C84_1155890 [compost metagenome]
MLIWHTIGTRENDVGDPFTKLIPNQLFRILPSVLNGVMQQPRNGLVFITTMLHHQACDTQQVREIRNTCRFASLFAVQVCCQRYSLANSARREKVGTHQPLLD